MGARGRRRVKLITKAPSAFVPYDRHPVRYFGFITFIRGPFQSFSQSHHIHTDIYQYEDARTRNTKYEPVTGFSLGGPGVFMLPLTYLSGVALCDFASWFELLARCSSNSTSTTLDEACSYGVLRRPFSGLVSHGFY